MKKLMAMVAVATAAAWSACGGERIAVDEVITHFPWDAKVDCVYTVSGLEGDYDYKGAFTLSVKKAGETVRRAVTNVLAAADGTYTNTFDCVALFGAGLYPNGGISVDLIRVKDRTGTPIGITGDVLIIDVSAGSSAASYPTKELTGVDIGTFNCDVYKTDKIVLRKVPAGSYYCQPGASVSTIVSQQLTTQGFYIGIFPVTQRQYELVMGKNPSWKKTDVAGNVVAQRPVEEVAWNTIRGGVASETAITALSADSFLQRLVAKTGLSGFDLPTEAQWEMACRANTTAAYGAYWNGTAVVELTSSTIGEVAWYADNSSNLTHAVGGKKPNPWGLYDMQGNVLEWCRDIFIIDVYTNYVVSTNYGEPYESGEWRVNRGGMWYSVATNCQPSLSYGYRADVVIDFIGFRLSRALP